MPIRQLSNEKRAPGCLGYIGDDQLPMLYRDLIISHEIKIPIKQFLFSQKISLHPCTASISRNSCRSIMCDKDQGLNLGIRTLWVRKKGSHDFQANGIESVDAKKKVVSWSWVRKFQAPVLLKSSFCVAPRILTPPKCLF